MTRILVLTSHDNNLLLNEANKGVTALMITAIESLRKFIPDAEFVTPGQFSKEFSSQHKFKVIKAKVFSYKILSLSESLKSLLLLSRCLLWIALRKCMDISANWLLNNELLKEIRQVDMVIVFIHDTFSDNGRALSLIDHTLEILTACLLNKRVVIWNSSIGPLRRWRTSLLGRFILNRASLITLRERDSLRHLQEAKINKPRLYVIPDTVFLLEPAEEARIREILHKEGIYEGNRPFIGICVSREKPLGQQGQHKLLRNILRNMYMFFSYCLPDRLSQKTANLLRRFQLPTNAARAKRKSLGELIDYLTERFAATVILVPHVIVPVVGKCEDMHDDRLEIQAVFAMVQRKDRVKVITGEYTTQEVKGIIGQCDLFVGMRMHSCVAAVSQLVPTLAIAYNYKFYGMMQFVGQEKWVCNRISSEELISKTEEIWENREKIREELSTKIPLVKKDALRHAELAAELLNLRL